MRIDVRVPEPTSCTPAGPRTPDSSAARACRWGWLLALLASCAPDEPEPYVMLKGTPPQYENLPKSAALPLLSGTTYRGFSSAEREPYSYPEFPHGNKDFNNFIAICGTQPELPWQHADDAAACEAGRDGFVIARDDAGAGVLSRIYFTSGSAAPGAQGRVLEERLRVFADGNPNAVYDTALASWRTGAEPPFVAPLAGWTSGALVSYVTIPYRSELRVLLDGLRSDSIYYYQVDTRSSIAPGSIAPAIAGEAISTNGTFLIQPGAEAVLFDCDCHGMLERIELSLAGADPALLRQIDLVLEWDELAQPAVDLPLDLLFASSQELRPFRTQPMQVQRSDVGVTRLGLGLPMPFDRSARVSLRNRGAVARSVGVALEGAPRRLLGAWGRLHADKREALGPFRPDQRFIAAELAGPGKLVGIAMSFDGRGHAAAGTPHPISFLEGDPILSIDGQVALHGTGTEDFFNSGWYFQDGPFEMPYGALVSAAADLRAGTARLTALRWFLDDNALEFAQSLRLAFEYGAYEPLAAYRYRSVVFSYR